MPVIKEENIRIKVSCVVVQTPDNKVWLGRHAKKESPRFDEWVIPGGKAKEGEDPSITAGRELREETGIICNLNRMTYLGMAELPSYIIEYYWLKISFAEKLKMVICEREYSDWKWFDILDAMDAIGPEDHQCDVLKGILGAEG